MDSMASVDSRNDSYYPQISDPLSNTASSLLMYLSAHIVPGIEQGTSNDVQSAEPVWMGPTAVLYSPFSEKAAHLISLSSCLR